MYLKNILYSAASPRTVVKVNKIWISALFHFGAEINLIKKSVTKKLNIPFIIDGRLKLININNNKTTLKKFTKI